MLRSSRESKSLSVSESPDYRARGKDASQRIYFDIDDRAYGTFVFKRQKETQSGVSITSRECDIGHSNESWLKFRGSMHSFRQSRFLCTFL